MTEEAQAKVRLGFDGSEVSSGLKGLSHSVGEWAANFKDKFHGVHSAFSALKMAFHGFGILGVVTAVEHLYHFYKELTDTTEEAKKLDEWLNSAREKAEKLVDEARKLKRELQPPSERVETDKEDITVSERKVKSVRDQIEARKKDVEELSKIQDGDAEQHYFYQKAQEEIKTKSKEIVDLELKLLEAKNKVASAQKSLSDSQKELNAKRAEEDKKIDAEVEEEWREKKKREEELHHLKMYHLEQEKIKRGLALDVQNINNAQDAKFQPSVNQLLQSGRWWHGKFRPSWASRQQQDINDETQGIQEDLARFGMSDDIKGRMNYVKGLQSDLSSFLGATGTPEERIAEATKKSEEHLSEIRDAFYKTD